MVFTGSKLGVWCASGKGEIIEADKMGVEKEKCLLIILNWLSGYFSGRTGTWLEEPDFTPLCILDLESI